MDDAAPATARFLEAPCFDAGGDAAALALLKQWARQPWREVNYAAFRDRLEEIGAPPEALKTADDFWGWARQARFPRVEGEAYPVEAGGRLLLPGADAILRRQRPTRTERLRFAHLHWSPKLLFAFGPQEDIPF